MPRKPTVGRAAPVAGGYEARLAEAERLLDRRKPFEAREMLLQLVDQRPHDPDVLSLLVEANFALRDPEGYLDACERLAQIDPDEPAVAFALAGAYMLNARPVMALRQFQRYLQRFPGHEMADEARQSIKALSEAVPELLAGVGLSGERGEEIALAHEEIGAALNRGDTAAVHRLVRQFERFKVPFAPVLNNESQAYMVEGRLDKAIETAERVLTFEPDNVHALANLVVYTCRLGRFDEARVWAARLRASEAPAADRWLKAAEAFSYLGNDEAVLDASRAADREGDIGREGGFAAAYLLHFAAVAHMRQGRVEEARRLWRQALRIDAGLEVVRENLDDLKQPVGERHAPWPFTFPAWVSRQVVEDLQRMYAKLPEDAGEDVVGAGLQRFLAVHPEIVALVPALLDRGDPDARTFALMIAGQARTPELLAALRDFALGQRGPDAQRHEAAQIAMEAGLFESETVRLWHGGEWRELMLMGFEIAYEAQGPPHPPAVEALLIRAQEALRRGDAGRAEELFRQALALEPDSPAIQHNLAGALDAQGRRDEAMDLTRALHERFPDYLFARAALARVAINEGRFDEAEALLKPMLKRKKLHVSEAIALLGTYVEFYHAQGSHEAARTWLDMLAGFEPDHPEVRRLRRMVAGGGVSRMLAGGRGRKAAGHHQGKRRR
jgi:tetratricopeptide (TPR) repeat protein